MRLYRMEFCKLYHRKSFLIWSAAVVFIIVTYFRIQVASEICTIGEDSYSGFEAVRKNRQITEEYRGVLTDEKVRDIVEKYGLPEVVEEYYPGFRDINYLNGFVTDYLSDGYMIDWDDYRVPTQVISISESALGELRELTGKDILLYYTRGWSVFLDVLQMGMMMASILILFSISVLFAEEGQTKMRQLIFTTKEGVQKDIAAKMAAAFTLTVLIYTAVVVLDFLMCAAVFGMDGISCPIGMLMPEFSIRPTTCMPVGSFAGISLLLDLLAVLLLCAVTFCVSAHFESCFHAAAVSAVCWGLPVLFRIIFRGFLYLFISGTPVFLVMYNNAVELMMVRGWGLLPVAFAVLLLAASVICGYYRYKNGRMAG